MGASASKASRATSATAGAAVRQFPNRATHPLPPTNPSLASNRSPAAASSQPVGPTVHPQPRASGTRDAAIERDAADPDFARSLRSIGPVQPNPTLSPTSTFNASSSSRVAGTNHRANPALAVLDARARLQAAAELEFQQAGRPGHPGREFLDVHTIRQIVILRDGRGMGAKEIEVQLGLKAGVVERLGPKGMVGVPTEMGRAEKGVDIV